ncbi:MAG: aldo/keto reductase [Propionibacteriaceae bacterium]|nr:aldo/keto reductase [Propionibacteriaceae bacterium]
MSELMSVMNDGYEIPSMGYGTWRVSDVEAEALVIQAIEVGYRHIDTATIYENEVGVGKGLKSCGLDRDDIFVTTKTWTDDLHDPEAALATSLMKLNLDYVDLYLIHWPAPGLGLYQKAWDTLITLRNKGLTKSIGVSNFNPDHLQAIAGSGVVPAINQVELHPGFPNTAVAQANTDQGTLTESYAPLGRGHYLDDPALNEIAVRLEATPAQVVLAWHLANGFIPLPKSANPVRIKENLDAEKLELSCGDLVAIDALATGTKICAEPQDFNGF